MDGRILVIDTRTGKEKKELVGHEGSVSAVAFLGDGKRIVSTSWDKSTRLWKRTGNEDPLTLSHNTEVKALAVSAAASKGAAGARDGEVKVFSLKSLKCIRNLQAHDSDISGLAFANEGNSLITTSWDGECKIWDMSSYESLETLVKQGVRVRSIALSPDGLRVFLGLHNGKILALNPAQPDEITEMEGHSDIVSALAVHPSGSQLVSGGWDRTIRNWSLKRFKQKWSQNLLTGVNALSWSSKGDILYSADFSGTIHAWHA
jgi:WD40 repeat protein